MAGVRRAGIFIVGLAVLVVGLILIPLPIPGGVVVALAGVAIWAREFEWAQHLLVWLRGQAIKRWRALPRWGRVGVAACLTSLGLALTWWSFN